MLKQEVSLSGFSNLPVYTHTHTYIYMYICIYVCMYAVLIPSTRLYVQIHFYNRPHQSTKFSPGPLGNCFFFIKKTKNTKMHTKLSNSSFKTHEISSSSLHKLHIFSVHFANSAALHQQF